MLTRAVTDSGGKWSVQSPHWLAWLQSSVGGTVKGRASSHLCGPGISRRDMSCYSPGLPMVPTALLAPDKQRNERVPWGRWETAASSPLPQRRGAFCLRGNTQAGIFQGHLVVYIPRALLSKKDWGINQSVKMLESTRGSQHEVVERQSWYKKESWLNPGLRELVLRFGLLDRSLALNFVGVRGVVYFLFFFLFFFPYTIIGSVF